MERKDVSRRGDEREVLFLDGQHGERVPQGPGTGYRLNYTYFDLEQPSSRADWFWYSI